MVDFCLIFVASVCYNQLIIHTLEPFCLFVELLIMKYDINQLEVVWKIKAQFWCRTQSY